MDVEKIAQFILKHTPYPDDEILREWIKRHTDYGTLIIIEKDKKIVAVARWNINGVTAKVLDTIVDKEYRNKRLLKLLVYEAWKRFPYLRFISFERERKYPDRELVVYQIEKFIRR